MNTDIILLRQETTETFLIHIMIFVRNVIVAIDNISLCMIAQTQGQNIVIWYSILFYVVINNSEFQTKASDKVEL